MTTQIPKEFLFNWRVENFLFNVQQNGECIFSPVFTAKTLGGTRWNLEFYPRGLSEDLDGYVSLYLYRSEKDLFDGEINLDVEVELYNCDRKIFETFTLRNEVFDKETYCGWDKLITTDELESMLIDLKEDALTIRCRLIGPDVNKYLPIGCNATSTIGINHCFFDWEIKYTSQKLYETKVAWLPHLCRLKLMLTATDDEIIIDIIRENFRLYSTVPIKGKISLVDSDGTKIVSKEGMHSFSILNDGEIWRFPSFIFKNFLTEQKNKCLVDGIFKLSCEFLASKGEVLTASIDLVHGESYGNSCKKCLKLN